MFKYFTLDEFACSCPCGESKMNLDFIARLDKARGISDISYKVNSGYRCSKHNKEIGSMSENHPSGHGADIECLTNSKRIRMLVGLIMAGFTRIGIRKDFIHVDDMDKVESCWLY